jgi:putative molybdopterin biosynthesis protein
MTMSAKRTIYLTTVPISEAVELARSAIGREWVGVEVIESGEAVGRVTAAPVFAKYSSPTFHSAAMDGVAVKASTTFAAREDSPLELVQGTGFLPVNTGNPLPDGFDAVVMIENVRFVDERTIALEAPVFPWQHVRRIGEDIVATELLLPQNRRLSPYDIGALLSAGIWEVPVWERIVVHFIPTGDEVLDFRGRPAPSPGQVVESNSQVIRSLGMSWGIDVVCVPPVADRFEAIKEAVLAGLASKAHIVVLGAGSSAGSKDYSRSVIEETGTLLVHGISAMPGKPTLLGHAAGKLLMGAPGYPVSAVIAFEEVLKPIVFWLGRQAEERRPRVLVEMTRKTPSRLGREEFMRAAIGRVGDRLLATPLAGGAGMITTLTRAQGLVRIPPEREGLEQGARVEAELLVRESELDRTLVAVGSHDNVLDIMANELMGRSMPVGLASTHVGSMGGINALRSGAAMMAGMHLFDPRTEDYNFPFLEKHAPGLELMVVNLVIRHQGLIVPKGNPKSIQGVEDLARREVTFINRQRGAGTRILLDHHLSRAGIDPEQVRGYGKEEFTHMAVAVNVLSGTSDCGMGILAAARALGLDFVPLARERYDLVIPRRFLDDPRIAAVLDLLQQERFQKKILDLGGYETTLTGKIMSPGVGLGE